MNAAALPRTGLQEALLERLQGLGVDTAPAHDLRGVALDQWIDQADDDLFAELTADLPHKRIPGEWPSLPDALASARNACAADVHAIGFTARRLEG